MGLKFPVPAALRIEEPFTSFTRRGSTGMTRQDRIHSRLQTELRPLHLEVINESSMHAVPPGSETHFKLVVVSDQFIDERLINRHRRINALLSEELHTGLHALALHTLTPEEWFAQGGRVPDSPLCMGGSKADSPGQAG